MAVFILGEATSLVRASSVTSGALLRLANDSRKQAGLPELKQNDQLKQAAEAKAKDMFKNDYFAHTSPKGVTPWHWIKQTGYQYGFAGENLAINYESAESQHKAWMKSPTHRANILSDKYQEIGVAVVSGKIDGKEAQVTVQVFASPKVAPVATKKPTEYLPTKDALVADVKGVEAELREVMVKQSQEETAPIAMVTTLTQSVIPPIAMRQTTQTQSELTLYIFLTMILLQIVVLATSMPFFYRAIQKIWLLSRSLRIKMEPVFSPDNSLVSIHAFDIHLPKAL
ncbi:MAG: CAP domain-containing protein [Patescibacteria group bacterium]